MLVQDCKQHFNTEDLYEVLHLSKESASVAEIKKAYYKQSMKWHPDKANDDEEAKQNATVKFQIITKVYGILSDKEKRAVYDETGAVDEENVISSDDTLNMWRTIFKKVSLEDIEKFCKKYKGSDDEKNDVIANYNLWNGDMGKIMESTIGSTHEDEERIKAIIDDLISEDVLKMTKKYRTTTSQKKTSSRKKAALREAKEAEEMLKEIQAREGANDLSSLILKRQANRGKDMDSYFDSLAEKYAPSKAKKSKK